jgi:hypothetical protein
MLGEMICPPSLIVKDRTARPDRTPEGVVLKRLIRLHMALRQLATSPLEAALAAATLADGRDG